MLAGAAGDDELWGGEGNDVIVGQGGDDTLVSHFWVAATDDVLGSLLCGGPGDDFLFANGPGHQCMDGGEDQIATAGQNDCVYSNVPADGGEADIGTAKNCASPSGDLSSRVASCGCDG